jgi:hypothetical protein
MVNAAQEKSPQKAVSPRRALLWRPRAFRMIPGVAVASPLPTNSVNISSLKPCAHWGFGWCFELRAPGNLCHLGLRLTLALITTGFLLDIARSFSSSSNSSYVSRYSVLSKPLPTHRTAGKIAATILSISIIWLRAPGLVCTPRIAKGRPGVMLGRSTGGQPATPQHSASARQHCDDSATNAPCQFCLSFSRPDGLFLSRSIAFTPRRRAADQGDMADDHLRGAAPHRWF